MIRDIVKVGFYTSLTSYIVFWLADSVRPGFVSFHFSVHIFLIFIILFGILWSHFSGMINGKKINLILPFISGSIFFIVTWRVLDDFDELQAIISILALMTPMLFISLLNEDGKDSTNKIKE